MTNGKAHDFGGDWTSKKLDVLAGYLVSYATALKNIANHLLEKLR